MFLSFFLLLLSQLFFRLIPFRLLLKVFPYLLSITFFHLLWLVKSHVLMCSTLYTTSLNRFPTSPIYLHHFPLLFLYQILCLEGLNLIQQGLILSIVYPCPGLSLDMLEDIDCTGQFLFGLGFSLSGGFLLEFEEFLLFFEELAFELALFVF